MNEDGKAWRTRYEAHLQSPYWDALRRDVVGRAEGWCEHCRKRKIVQLHHLHYDTMGQETLIDVLGVCGRCHRHLHGKPIAPRPKAPKRRRRRKIRVAAKKKLVVLTPFRNPKAPDTDWTFRDRLRDYFPR